MAAVAPPQRLGGVEREAVAERHEGVLQLGPGRGVGVHVAGRNGPQPEPPGQRGEGAVAGPVVAGVGTLQLDVEALGTEPLEQRSQRLRPSPLAQHRAFRATGQADQAVGVGGDGLR